MRQSLGLAIVALACALAACGGDKGLSCESTARYSAAVSSPPVRIPDDLSPPDETNSLKLPIDGGTTAAPTRPCLESPPGFYADGAPGGTRLGNPPAPPAAAPPAAPPAAPAPPADDPERRIEN